MSLISVLVAHLGIAKADRLVVDAYVGSIVRAKSLGSGSGF